MLGTVVVVAVAFVAVVRVSAATAPGYVVIVHASNGVGSLERPFLKQAFLKKRTRWPDGALIRPVDLAPSSPVRERFSREVLERSVAAVRSYWQQLIFSGRDVPPVELADSEAVVSYVARNPGAVGYVDETAALAGVRAVPVTPQ